MLSERLDLGLPISVSNIKAAVEAFLRSQHGIIKDGHDVMIKFPKELITAKDTDVVMLSLILTPVSSGEQKRQLLSRLAAA